MLNHRLEKQNYKENLARQRAAGCVTHIVHGKKKGFLASYCISFDYTKKNR